MTNKDIKAEARQKLALNIHQAIIVYTVEFAIYITLLALIVMSCVSLGSNMIAGIVMICYGVILLLIAMVGSNMVNYAMVDFYLVSFKCKQYNVRRLGETLARGGMTKILLLSLKRTMLAFLLTLCLIVPGIIYMIRTSMANHLLVANPKMKASAVLSASNKVMSGKTGAYFALTMSMIGWWLLGIITLGLGFIFILPYINLVKSVYYKRNLQGDKTVYVFNPQAVQQTAYSTTTAYSPQQPITQAGAEPRVAPQPQSQQPVSDAPAPIDTLEAEAVRDMAEAMRDFGNPVEDVPEVPEVPISPPVVNAKKSAGGERVITRPVDDTNLVESEHVLSTEELIARDESLNRQINAIYTKQDGAKPVRDYISAQCAQSPDDFITSEVQSVSLDELNATGGDAFAPEQATEPPVMSESEFDDFIREFESDIPKTEPEFVPLKRTERATDGIAHAAPTARAERPQPAAAQPAAKPEEGMSRAEKIRREREERLKNLKK